MGDYTGLIGMGIYYFYKQEKKQVFQKILLKQPLIL